jgi:DNA invertase Pin-like site-specific DNA recombinase
MQVSELSSPEKRSYYPIPARRAVAYVRVSTAAKSRRGDAITFEQNPDVQEQPLRDLVRQRGWKLEKVYSDRASGSKEQRAGLNALLLDARRGLFDIVVVWRFDRFARSVKQLVLALEEFRALGIDFISHQEALDTSTPMGKAMFTIIAAMAELERTIIRERVVAGLDHAQRNGTRSGRPVGRPKVIFDHDKVVELRRQRLSWRRIARELGVGVTTVRSAYKRACEQMGEHHPSSPDAARSRSK